MYRGTREERIEFVRKKVDSTIRKFDVGLACVEGYSFASKGSSMTDLAEMRGVILNCLHRGGVAYEIIQPPTLKKLATGDGRAEKPEMIAQAQEQWPGCPDEDNVADAYFLAAEAHRRYLNGYCF